MREMPNLREAVQFTCVEAPAIALEMTAAMRPMWVTGGILSETRRWLELALAAAPTDPDSRG
jgi:predicted ATPase